MAVALRKTLLVPLNDSLAVVREFLNPNASLSGLDRCLRRHGVGRPRDLKANDERSKHSGFKADESGYIQIDVKYQPQMASDTSRGYLFVAINRATFWSSLPFTGTRQRPMRGVVYVTWNVHVRSVTHHLNR